MEYYDGGKRVAYSHYRRKRPAQKSGNPGMLLLFFGIGFFCALVIAGIAVSCSMKENKMVRKRTVRPGDFGSAQTLIPVSRKTAAVRRNVHARTDSAEQGRVRPAEVNEPERRRTEPVRDREQIKQISQMHDEYQYLIKSPLFALKLDTLTSEEALENMNKRIERLEKFLDKFSELSGDSVYSAAERNLKNLKNRRDMY